MVLKVLFILHPSLICLILCRSCHSLKKTTGRRRPPGWRPKLRRLADQGIYFGTSSWKYEGWLGSIYTPERYATRGKFSRKKFEADAWPSTPRRSRRSAATSASTSSPRRITGDGSSTRRPRSLLFGFKVPEEITVATWPGHARYGTRAGQANEHFLDARHLRAGLRPAARAVPRPRRHTDLRVRDVHRRRPSRTPPTSPQRLDPFLGALPGGFRYAVEIRNPEYLRPDYFAMLASHNVAHVFNAWTRMPELGDQAQLPGAFTADFTVVRACFARVGPTSRRSGASSPTALTQEPDPATRDATATDRRASSAASDATGLPLRQQPPRRQRTVNHRGGSVDAEPIGNLSTSVQRGIFVYQAYVPAHLADITRISLSVPSSGGVFMRLARIILVVGLACATGCTTGRLRQRTINQGSTLPELQYQQVLDNLAQFATNPSALPWHVNLREGTTQVTDSIRGARRWTSARRSPGSRSSSGRGPPWPSGGCRR